MCTVTWLSEGPVLQLFDNRDERNRRAAAEPPRMHRRGALPFLAPVDGDFGGTWVTVNGCGLVLCLLNRYLDGDRQDRKDYLSRGLLVRDLASSESPDTLAADLTSRDLRIYRAFSLLVARAGAPPSLWIWNGERLRSESAMMPLVSSPRAAEVLASRRKVLEEMRSSWSGSEAELLMLFHRSHRPNKGAASVCMHHARAKTVSFTRVQVDDRRVVMDYVAGSPCEHPAPQRLQMKRTK